MQKTEQANQRDRQIRHDARRARVIFGHALPKNERDKIEATERDGPQPDRRTAARKKLKKTRDGQPCRADFHQKND